MPLLLKGRGFWLPLVVPPAVVPVPVVVVVAVAIGVVVVVVPVPAPAGSGLVVMVAEVTIPLASVVSVIGFWILSRPTQFKPLALNVAFRRLARKPKSVVAVAPPSGEG